MKPETSNVKRSSGRTIITREGTYYLFVLAFVLGGALLREINLMLLLACLMFGPLIVNYRYVLTRLRELSVERVFPRVASAGEFVTVELSVTTCRRALGLTFTDTIHATTAFQVGDKSSTTAAISAHVAVPAVEPNGVAKASYRLRFAERGQYTIGPMTISTAAPLGLFRRTVEQATTLELLVYPRLGRLSRRWEQLIRGAHNGGGQPLRQQGIHEGDFYGLRDWRQGDPRRGIHWRTSARRGTLMVRQNERTRHADLVLVIDLPPADGTPQAGKFNRKSFSERIEQVVSFAATVVTEVCRRGNAHLTLAVAGAVPSVLRGSASPALLREAMERLAKAAPGQPNSLAEVLRKVLPATSGRGTLVIASAGKVSTNERRLVELAPQVPNANLLRRALMFSADDDSLFEVFQPPTVVEDIAARPPAI